MKSHTFTLWSGGLDSTYLIYCRLSEGYKVSAGYVEIMNNEVQSKREQEAIERLVPLLKAEFGDLFNYMGTVVKVDVKTSGNHVALQQAILWPVVMHVLPDGITEIAIGYVMNDCAISYLNEIKAMFDGFKGLLVNPKWEVTFPLSKSPKQHVHSWLPSKLRDHVTWCESHETMEHGWSCRRCNSCKRMVDLGLLDELKKETDQVVCDASIPGVEVGYVEVPKDEVKERAEIPASA